MIPLGRGWEEEDECEGPDGEGDEVELVRLRRRCFMLWVCQACSCALERWGFW